VREPDAVTFGQYIAWIIGSTGLFVSEASNGSISLFNGPGWDGRNPLVEVDDDRIIAGQVEFKYADSDNPLIYGYNCLYPVGDTVANQSRALGDTDPAVLQYGPVDVLTPFPLAGDNIASYKLIYADQPSAEYFGERLLSYYSINRRRITANVVLTDSELDTIEARQFDTVNLSMGYGLTLSNEPARIMSFTKNEAQNRIENMVLELSNKGWPAL